MKKTVCVLLSLLMLVGMTACGEEAPSVPSDNQTTVTTAPSQQEDTTPTVPSEEEKNGVEVVTDVDVLDAEDMQYVMIYNPNVYDPKMGNQNALLNLSTGTLGAQVDVNANRAEGLETEEDESQSVMFLDDFEIPEEMKNIEGDRADVLAEEFSVGDKRKFYAFVDLQGGTDLSRDVGEFECAYAGEYCNVWMIGNSVTEQAAEEYGREFDETLYEKTVETFGEPYFDDKIQLLFYPMDTNPLYGYGGVMGAFTGADMVLSSQVSQAEAEMRGYNLNMNIIGVNSLYIMAAVSENAKSMMCTTMAHELQHLLIYSAGVRNGGALMQLWLNEAMSGYIEEVFVSGVQAYNGRYNAYMASQPIRYGQSLFNFPQGPIDVYGSVYLFSEYLAALSDEDVYSRIHSYWSDAFALTVNEYSAIADNVTDEAYDKIDRSIIYPDDLVFVDDDQEWASKLALDFYLSMLSRPDNSPEEFENVDAQALLYDAVDASEIEGGGRVIVALNDHRFEIPDDADDGMIYVGLNGDFEVVTDFVYR